MESVIYFMQSSVTLIGFLTLALVGLKALVNEESGLGAMIMGIQLVAIKLAGVALIAYVMLMTYASSGGTLTVSAIGLYVACIGILISLLKDVNVNGSLVSDVQAVVSHRAKKIQASLAEQAEQARKAQPIDSDRKNS